MQALSTMKQTERLRVLEYLYNLLCYYEAWESEISSCIAELDKYRVDKINIRKKHKTIFGIYMWIVDTFIMVSVIFVIAKYFDGKDLISTLLSLLVPLFFIGLLLIGYMVLKKADKKSCSDVILSEYLAEVLLYCDRERKKAANNVSCCVKEYVIPGTLTSTKAVEYVYGLLVQYPQLQLSKAIEYYNSMERDRRNREEMAKLSQQLEAIKKQADLQHKEKMDIARQIESENRSIANMLDDIRYATGSHY